MRHLRASASRARNDGRSAFSTPHLCQSAKVGHRAGDLPHDETLFSPKREKWSTHVM
jgi:hypothetical protein